MYIKTQLNLLYEIGQDYYIQKLKNKIYIQKIFTEEDKKKISESKKGNI